MSAMPRLRIPAFLCTLALGACGPGPEALDLAGRLAALDVAQSALDYVPARRGPPAGAPPAPPPVAPVDLLAASPLADAPEPVVEILEGSYWRVHGACVPRSLAEASVDLRTGGFLLHWRVRPDRLDFNVGILLRLVAPDAEGRPSQLLVFDVGHTGGVGRHEVRVMVSGDWIGPRLPVPIVEGGELTITAAWESGTLRLWIVDDLGWTRLEQTLDRIVPPSAQPARLVLSTSGQVESKPELDVRISELRVWRSGSG